MMSKVRDLFKIAVQVYSDKNYSFFQLAIYSALIVFAVKDIWAALSVVVFFLVTGVAGVAIAAVEHKFFKKGDKQ